MLSTARQLHHDQEGAHSAASDLATDLFAASKRSGPLPIVQYPSLNDCRFFDDPAGFYAELHRAGVEIFRLRAPLLGQEVFAVASYELSQEVLRRANDLSAFNVTKTKRASLSGGIASAKDLARNIMLYSDGSAHVRLRSPAQPTFSPASITNLRPVITEYAESLLAGLSGRREFDLMNDFARRLPYHIVGDLLGIPFDRTLEPWLTERLSVAGEAQGLFVTQDLFNRASGAIADVAKWLATELPRFKDAPLGRALREAKTGAALSSDEFAASFVFLMLSAIETTSWTIANGIALAGSNSEIGEMLRDSPNRIPAFVNEVLRFEPTVHLSSRFAVSDTEIAGVPIPKGERVVVMLGAAQHDPKRFSEPERFLMDRPGGYGLAFGTGVHTCLGNSLALVEVEIALHMLLSRFRTIQPISSDAPERVFDGTFRGYRRFPVAIS